MTTLTFILSLMGTVALLGGFYLAVMTIFGLRTKVSRPRYGLVSSQPGQVAFWMSWDPGVYVVEAYRITITVYHPTGLNKEFRASYTLYPPPKSSFLQPIILPAPLRNLIESKSVKGSEAVLTFAARTTDERCILKDYSLAKFRKVYSEKPTKVKGVQELPALAIDEPATSTLDYEELVAYKERIGGLIAAAKAKEAAQKKAKEAAAAAANQPPTSAGGAPQDKPVAAKPVVAEDKA